MKEMDKALDMAVSGRLKQKAIASFEKQTRQWDIIMPLVQPLVLDFGLGDFYHTGLIEYWIANEIEAGYCGKFLFVFDGQRCPMHRHKAKHETFYIVKGSVQMTFGEKVIPMKAGEVLPVAAGKFHSFIGAGPALLLEISNPCIVEDNYFEDTRIPIGQNFKTRTEQK